MVDLVDKYRGDNGSETADGGKGGESCSTALLRCTVTIVPSSFVLEDNDIPEGLCKVSWSLVFQIESPKLERGSRSHRPRSRL
jgi:hypothetical protein